jgi:hypothetical protein
MPQMKVRAKLDKDDVLTSKDPKRLAEGDEGDSPESDAEADVEARRDDGKPRRFSEAVTENVRANGKMRDLRSDQRRIVQCGDPPWVGR